MRLKELRGLPVIDPTAARRIGVVTDYQVDPTAGRLAALDIDGANSAGIQRILAQRVRRVGGSAVILTARGGSLPAAPVDDNESWLDISTLTGLDVMGDDGNRIGRLVDATFDQDSLEVVAYLLRSTWFERLFGRRGRIQPAEVHSCSRELMMVTTGRVSEAPGAADEQDASVGMGVPLKDEDRLEAPAFGQVHDGKPVATHRR